MKLKGRITILCHSNRNVTIEIKDELSSATFLQIEITPQNFVAALGRLSHVEIDMEVGALEIVGKKMLMDNLKFLMPKGIGYGDERIKTAIKLAKKFCPEGWRPDTFFGSQNSFVTENGKLYGHCIIRKWVYPNEA